MADRKTLELLLISGSLRSRSTNTAFLRTVSALANARFACQLYDGMRTLPHFDPDLDREPLPAPVESLRAAIRAADALLFCTPEYAGALPGSFKNLLDWTIGDDQPGSIYRKPVAWINISAAPTGARDAHESLAKVLGYAHAQVVEAACAAIPISRQMVSGDGLVTGPHIPAGIFAVIDAFYFNLRG